MGQEPEQIKEKMFENLGCYCKKAGENLWSNPPETNGKNQPDEPEVIQLVIQFRLGVHLRMGISHCWGTWFGWLMHHAATSGPKRLFRLFRQHQGFPCKMRFVFPTVISVILDALYSKKPSGVKLCTIPRGFCSVSLKRSPSHQRVPGPMAGGLHGRLPGLQGRQTTEASGKLPLVSSWGGDLGGRRWSQSLILAIAISSSPIWILVGGLEHFLFSHILGF